VDNTGDTADIFEKNYLWVNICDVKEHKSDEIHMINQKIVNVEG
jgi:hypothetical protein